MPSILDILTGAGAALDLPGSSVRDLLAGQNPVDQYMSPFSFENRTTGRGLLEQHGLLAPNRPGLDMGDVAGFGAEVALDPLNLLMGAGLARRMGQRGSAMARNTAAVDRFEPLSVQGVAGDMSAAPGIVEEFGSVARNPSGSIVGGANVGPPMPMEASVARRIAPDAVQENARVGRFHGIELGEPYHGRGAGQQMYLDALASSPLDWIYNSGNSEMATRAIEALRRKGLADVHWQRQLGGPRIMRLTPEGRQMAGTNQLIRQTPNLEPVPRAWPLMAALGLHNATQAVPQ